VRPIVRHHHERWDGDGYPDGLAGEAIPIGARIVAVADAVEVMSCRKLYRRPLEAADVIEELRRCSGGQWDPRVVDVALHLIESGEVRISATGLHIEARGAVPAPPPVCSVLLVGGGTDEMPRLVGALESVNAGVQVSHTPDAATAAALCRNSTWALAVVDDGLPDRAGVDLLAELAEHCPGVPIVLITEPGKGFSAVEAFRLGATDFVVRGASLLDDLTERARGLLTAA
jgi:CheY-like chemotaxis protein